MKYYLLMICLVLSLVSLSQNTKRIYQNERLVGVEHFDDQGRVVLRKGIVNFISDTIQSGIEHTQFFYDDSGRLSIEVIGGDLYNSEIKSFAYGPLGLVSISEYKTQPNDLLNFLYWPATYIDPEAPIVFSNTHPAINDTLWFELIDIQKEMNRRSEIKILEVLYHKGIRIESTYGYGWSPEIKRSSYSYLDYSGSGQPRTVHISDCTGYRTGRYLPSRIAKARCVYDQFGRRLEYDEYGSGPASDDIETLFVYDAMGRIEKLEKQVRGYEDPKDYRPYIYKSFERQRHYTYDAKGHLTREVAYNTKGKIVAEYILKRALNGRVIQANNHQGESKAYQYSYDSNDRLVKVVAEVVAKDAYDFRTKLNWVHTYTYSADGFIVGVTETIKVRRQVLRYDYRIVYE